jgi:hypothetical protein
MKETSKGCYDLQIGNHLLKGKAIDLPKQFVMTEKCFNGETGAVEYRVRAIIKRKILFAGRPTPLRLNQQAEFAQGLSKMRKLN